MTGPITEANKKPDAILDIIRKENLIHLGNLASIIARLDNVISRVLGPVVLPAPEPREKTPTISTAVTNLHSTNIELKEALETLNIMVKQLENL
jgi:hypothetical protein